MMAGEDPKKSKIEVAVELINDDNVAKLEAFGKQFSSAVDRLEPLLRSFSAGGGIGGTGSPGQPSATASFAPGTIFQPNGAPFNLTPPAMGAGAVPPAPGQPSPGASTPDGPGWLSKRLAGKSFSGPELSTYEKAQIRLGQFPSGAPGAQAMFIGSYLAGMKGWSTTDPATGQAVTEQTLHPDGTPAIKGEDGRFYLKTNKTMAGISEAMGGAGQFMQRVPQIWNQIERIPGLGMFAQLGGAMLMHPGAMASQGQVSGGFGRTGGMIGGLPFLSPAAMHAAGMDISAIRQSWGGLNPNYSFAQAREAQNAIAQSGYWGDDAHYLASQMRSGLQNAQMSPEQMMQLYDPVMRFMGSDKSNPELTALAATIDNLGQVSRAAHIGLTQLNQSLVSAAAQVISGTGALNPTPALAAMAAGMRIDPSVIASGMMGSQNLIMGAAITGQHLSDVMTSPVAQVGAAYALPSLVIKRMMGGLTFQQFSKLPSEARKQTLDRMWMAYSANNKIFGGLSPIQALNQLAKGTDPAKRMQAFVEGTVTDNQQGFLKAIHDFGGTASHKMHDEFLNKHFDLSQQSGRKDAHKWMSNQMGKYMDRQNNKAANKVTLTLDPWARQLVKIKGGKDVSERNKGQSGWHTAADIGLDVALGGAGFALGGPAGAALGVGLANAAEKLF